MKNTAPLRRKQAIVSFSRDHHFGLLLIWKIRQGLKNNINPARISKYVLYFFKEDLEKHFTDEEELLFCAISSNDTQRKKAEADHFEIRNLMDLIAEDKNNPLLLNDLANLLEKHIRFEERELFNYLQQNINDKSLATVANRNSDSSKSIDDNWEDIFWSTKQ